MNKISAILILLLFACGGAFSQEMQKKEEKKQEQFIYVLKLVPRLLDEKNWTEQKIMTAQLFAFHVALMQ